MCSTTATARASIWDLGIFDQRGKLSNVLVKGETFSIKERIRFHAALEAPIFTFTIKDKRGPISAAPTPSSRAAISGR